jgi:hypothetical protein
MLGNSRCVCKSCAVQLGKAEIRKMNMKRNGMQHFCSVGLLFLASFRPSLSCTPLKVSSHLHDISKQLTSIEKLSCIAEKQSPNK